MKRFTWRLTQLLLIPVLLVLGALTMLPAVPTLAAGSGTWTLTGSLHIARADSTATLLPNGQVLVVGGGGTSAELYTPATGSWTTTGSMHTARDYPSTALLPNGQVLVAGGSWAGPLASAELYNPHQRRTVQPVYRHLDHHRQPAYCPYLPHHDAALERAGARHRGL